MNNDAFERSLLVANTEQNMPRSRQASQPAREAQSWGPPGAANLNTYGYTSARPSGSTTSYDGEIAAFADLSFSQQHTATSPYIQADAFPSRDLHDRKRVKVESEGLPIDSIDYWMSFDDDMDKMGSFEIDYSKRPYLANSTESGTTTNSMPGLGSGLYSTATAPFREEDFFDDSAFEQMLSDDEELFEASTKSNRKKSVQLGNRTAPQSFQPNLGVAPGLKGTTRQIQPNNAGDCSQGTIVYEDEQRRFLEEALNSGRIPGALIPPNGFGLGFGAGMGGRTPTESDDKAAEQSSLTAGRQADSTYATGATHSIVPDGSECSKRQPKQVSTTKGVTHKKGTATAAPKVRSADRIAHNDVERKYRTNLKDRIAELREAVPALHCGNGGGSGDGDSEGGGDGGGQGNLKISKGTVLTKATEYIHHLEAKNKAIMQDHQQLSRRLQAFEILLSNTAAQSTVMPNHSMTLFDPRGFC